jgi:hypothetical protein
MSEFNLKLINIQTNNFLQDNVLELNKTVTEIFAKNKKHKFNIHVIYNLGNQENIAITLKDECFNITFSTIIELSDIYKHNIYLQDNTTTEQNKDIFSFKSSLYFLYLMLKVGLENSSYINLKYEPYKIKETSFVFPKLNNKDLVTTLEEQGIIAKADDLLSSDFIALGITYQKYNFMFCLVKF